MSADKTLGRVAATATAALTLVGTLVACGSESGVRSAAEAATMGPGASKKPLGAGHEQLQAGLQVFDLTARAHSGTAVEKVPRIAITLPGGWFNYDGWAVQKGRTPRTVFVTFWDVDLVYPTPCDWKYKPMIDPGRGVAGLASALARQPLRHATAPEDVVLGGFHGKYLQWSVPTDIAFAAARPDDALFPNCDEKTFQSWTARGWAGDRYQQAPGQVDRIWILNIHGRRLVLDVSYLPKSTPADRAELERVVKSIRFLNSRR
jgi:hypothetical protein